MALKKSDVNYIYQSYLGRDPDEGAIEDLVGQNISRDQLANTILKSDEYKSLTPEDQITRQYQNVLGRGPSDNELQRVMGMDNYFNYALGQMVSGQPERLDFSPLKLRNDLMKLPEANLVRVFKNYLGRLPDEDAYRNYLKPIEVKPPTGRDMMGPQYDSESNLVDTNYDYAMDPKRIEEVGWSPEAQEYINSKFEAEARKYAEEKGIELPDDFSALAQLRNPYQDNRAGMEGLNLISPISFKQEHYGIEPVSDYNVNSQADRYDLPTYAMWFSKSGTAAFKNEDKAQQMIDLYGPAAAVDAYAQNPGGFMRDAAAGVYVNNWLEQNLDPRVTESGANKDKLASLGQRYQDISNRAIEFGADPNDIAKFTAQKVDKVANDYQTYVKDMNDDPWMDFLLAAGGLFLGAYGLSNILSAAGATAGSGGISFAAGTGPTLGTGTYFSGATSLPGYVTGGMGAGTAAGAAGAGSAAATTIGTGYAGTAIPSNIFTTPTPGISGAGTPTVPSATKTLAKGIKDTKDVFDTIDSLSDIVSGGQQPQQQQRQGQAPLYRNPSELFPVTNTMISPERWAEMTTPRRTFVGGLGAMRDMT
jgi:hypothetical protein